MQSLDKAAPELTPELHTDTPDPLHDSPGRQLQLARKNAEITIDQVASELHLSSSTITALEADHYDGLPSEVFVSGYLRAYARLLGIDPVPLLDNYRRLQPSSTSSHLALSSMKRPEPSNKSISGPVVAAVVVIALGAAAWFSWTSLGGSEFLAKLSSPSAAEEDATQPNVNTAPQPVLPRRPLDVQPVVGASEAEGALGGAESAQAPEAAAAAEDSGAPSELAPEDSDETPDASPAATPETNEGTNEGALPSDQEDVAIGLLASRAATADPEASPAGDADSEAPVADASNSDAAEITMLFTGPCWVDVRDSTGEFKLFGEMNKGDRKVLGGRAPYSIILGNAAAVALTVDGEPFDVEAVARGNVARFDLDPATL
ncbi:helix-turn-helix domain-containing protein [Rhabdochromatium marinum]|uniref:helix-turn-helix domain-containing protein n=1 Tax=Rhabdochromatium marinum TaxID=48729 RepID=UPI001905B090|nr:RodZ domain-containing protein [Rhabdochromatium marinum]MBK1649659.1 hypothetical protein [Rhabdochromatium marinum]